MIRFGFGVNHPSPSADEDMVELVAMLDSEMVSLVALVGAEMLEIGRWNSGVGEPESSSGNSAERVPPGVSAALWMFVGD